MFVRYGCRGQIQKLVRQWCVEYRERLGHVISEGNRGEVIIGRDCQGMVICPALELLVEEFDEGFLGFGGYDDVDGVACQ